MSDGTQVVVKIQRPGLKVMTSMLDGVCIWSAQSRVIACKHHALISSSSNTQRDVTLPRAGAV